MNEKSPSEFSMQGKRGWTALAGVAVFVAGGLLLGHLTRDDEGGAGAAGSVQLAGMPSLPARSAAPDVSTPPAPGPAALDESARDPEFATQTSRSAERGFDCMISANEVIEIGSPVTGLIQGVFVERGDYVAAGQIVATLESSAERAALEIAQARVDRRVELQATEANLSLRTRQRGRAVALFDKKSLSLDDREQAETEAALAKIERERAESDHRLAVLQLEQARMALQRRLIVSPISGLVVERMMSGGEVVDQDTIMRIAEIDRLRVEVILPSNLFGKPHIDDTAQVTPEAPYNQPRDAKVVVVDQIIDGASGTFGVRLIIPNPKHDLPAGLRCKARFPGFGN